MSTVILAIGDRWKTDPAFLFLQEEAKKLEVQIVHVSSPDNSRATSNPFRLESKTVAQFGRLFGVHLAAHDPDDVLVTADVDMMVINAASYLKGHWSGADFKIYELEQLGWFPCCTSERTNKAHSSLSNELCFGPGVSLEKIDSYKFNYSSTNT